jgi:hypothetical protein
MPIPDAAAGYDPTEADNEHAPTFRACNAYLRASVELCDAEEKYARCEIDAAALGMARTRAETAYAALEKHWTMIDRPKGGKQ